MPKKRISRGRSKGDKGRQAMVQCSYCNALVPRDKAKKVTRWTSIVDPRLMKELEQQGVHISRERTTKYLCISCAVHRGVVKVRGKEERMSKATHRR